MCQKNECSIVEIGYWVNPNKKIFTRGKFYQKEQIETVLQAQSYTGLFKTVFSYNRTEIDQALIYGDLYFDFDALEQFDLAREDAVTTIAFLKTVFRLQEEQIHIYFSGSKGIHLIVPAEILGVEPCDDLNSTYHWIAKEAQRYLKHQTLDLMIYDKKRLFRVPNSIHEKTGLHKIRLTIDQLKKMSFDDIKERASSPQKNIFKKNPTPTNYFANKQYNYYRNQAKQESLEQKRRASQRSNSSNLKCTPPCITHLLTTGAKEGMRNNTAAALASFHKSKGLSLTETIEVLNAWNRDVNTTPLASREIKRTCESIYHSQAKYGCNKLKELSRCDKENCPLMKKVYRK